MNKIDNISEINKTINKTLPDHDINELEKRFRDRNKKGNGMFTSQKKVCKIVCKTFLAQLHAGNNSKKLKNE